jgi:hypothetical protein
MAPDDDAETVIYRLPSAEVDAGLIDIVDGNDVTQKEHGLVRNPLPVAYYALEKTSGAKKPC